ncbi:MAG TPA: cytochrome c3 family protein [Anaeromyxobacteraceae bacterium]|nr:cytochrome c3 family protein [Anaeromyxobacteraceae bacterium]
MAVWLLAVMSAAGGRAFPQAAPSAPGEGAGSRCIACHASFAGRKHLHHPVAVGDCDACHRVQARHLEDGARAAVTTPEACTPCHEGKPAGDRSHKALGIERRCGNCHDPHGSDEPHLLRKAAPELCTRCHTRVHPRPAVHRLASAGACLACHAPHGSRHEKLLRREPGDLCLDCHGRRIASGGRTLADIRWKIEAAGVLHKPARQCLACHLAHPRAGPDGLLVKPSIEEVCFSCHEASAFPLAGPGRRVHPRTQHPVEGPTDGLVADRPLTCATCHEPHGSSMEHLFRFRYTPGDGPSGQPCFVCHREGGGQADRRAPPWNEQDVAPPGGRR